MVSLEEAYDQGWSDGYNDLIPDCPYPEGSPEAEAWTEGYAQGSNDC